MSEEFQPQFQTQIQTQLQLQRGLQKELIEQSTINKQSFKNPFLILMRETVRNVSWDWIAYGYGGNRNSIWGELDLSLPSGKRFRINTGCFYNSLELSKMLNYRKKIGFEETLNMSKNNVLVTMNKQEYMFAYERDLVPSNISYIAFKSNSEPIKDDDIDETMSWNSAVEFKELINKLAIDKGLTLPLNKVKLDEICTELAEVIVNKTEPNLVRFMSKTIPKNIVMIISEFMERSLITQSEKFNVKCPKFDECNKKQKVDDELCGFYGFDVKQSESEYIYPNHIFYGRDLLYDHDTEIEL